ncbi:GAF domain-containing protein [Arthrobacter sp. CAN_A214]|uniref:GAF and ANTAR domain-containing protein n=1 Tax=Arthrobacter sp. CAN_A214 TaxID=2787720 RepID=UPI0018CB9F29
MATNSSLNEIEVVFGRVKGLLLTAETVNHAVDLLAEAAKEGIPGAIGAGVTLVRNGQRISTGSTDALVSQADDMQYELGEGPCLSAWATGEPMRIDDTRTEPRWRKWNAAVSQGPVRSCVSVPLLRGQDHLGAIKVYSAEPSAFDAATEALLLRFAVPAAALLGHVQTTETPQQITDELLAALRTRDVIGLAKGILMGGRGMAEEQAHTEIIERAKRLKITMDEAAQQLVDHLTGPES